MIRNLEQIVLMGWINYFWSGFLLVKLPFGLTQRFRPLTQRGIELSSLDVRYVSSLSWYFICIFGLRGIISYFLGIGEVPLPQDLSNYMSPLGVSTAQPLVSNVAPNHEIGKRFHSEKEFIQILPAVSHVGSLNDIPEENVQ